MARPRGRATQPNRQLSMAITNLRDAIENEPEPQDRAMLEQALRLMGIVNTKNLRESGRTTASPTSAGLPPGMPGS